MLHAPTLLLCKQLEVSKNKEKYLDCESDVSTSSTAKGQEKSMSSRSSGIDSLLELLENNLGDPLEEKPPENLPESSLPSFRPCKFTCKKSKKPPH